MSRRSTWFFWLVACGGDGAGAPSEIPRDAGIAVDGGGVSPNGDGALGTTNEGGTIDAPADAPDAGLPAVWLHSVSESSAHATVTGFLAGADVDLGPVTKAFYQAYGDDYDFLYLLADTSAGTGRFIPVRRPAIPGIGLTGALDRGADFGSPLRLKGVAALRLGPGNGPTIHETLHYWSQFLSPAFGFGREAGGARGPHWGHASVQGSHGGFDLSTLRCITTMAAPTGSPPACPTAGGRMAIDVALFEPGASNDTVPYKPIELYLMGLVPSSTVTETIVVMDDPVFEPPAGPRLHFSVAGFHEVTISNILAVHGPREPASQTAFRGALVLVTAAPPTPQQNQLAESWAKRFGGEGVPGRLLSFAEATGGRATMTTRLGPRR